MRRGGDSGRGDLLLEVIDRTVALFHGLKATAAAVHGDGEDSAGRRGLLRSLGREGPRTVPALARARPVSRQHVQALVNGLRADGLVELRRNPAHRRSHLVALTGKGRRRLARLVAKERRFLSGLGEVGGARALRKTAAVLAALKRALAQSGAGGKP